MNKFVIAIFSLFAFAASAAMAQLKIEDPAKPDVEISDEGYVRVEDADVGLPPPLVPVRDEEKKWVSKEVEASELTKGKVLPCNKKHFPAAGGCRCKSSYRPTPHRTSTRPASKAPASRKGKEGAMPKQVIDVNVHVDVPTAKAVVGIGDDPDFGGTIVFDGNAAVANGASFVYSRPGGPYVNIEPDGGGLPGWFWPALIVAGLIALGLAVLAALLGGRRGGDNRPVVVQQAPPPAGNQARGGIQIFAGGGHPAEGGGGDVNIFVGGGGNAGQAPDDVAPT